jgi:hypothetical protein
MFFQFPAPQVVKNMPKYFGIQKPASTAAFYMENVEFCAIIVKKRNYGQHQSQAVALDWR